MDQAYSMRRTDTNERRRRFADDSWSIWRDVSARRAEPLDCCWMRRQVPEPALREMLTPDYRLGCKRILHSDTCYPVLARSTATLVNGATREVHAHAVSAPVGSTRHAANMIVYCIVYCTGFQSTDMPFSRCVYGREGRSLYDVQGPCPVHA